MTEGRTWRGVFMNIEELVRVLEKYWYKKTGLLIAVTVSTP